MFIYENSVFFNFFCFWNWCHSSPNLGVQDRSKWPFQASICFLTSGTWYWMLKLNVVQWKEHLKSQKTNFLELQEVKSDQFLTWFVLESGFLSFLLDNKVCQPCQELVRPLRYPTECWAYQNGTIFSEYLEPKFNQIWDKRLPNNLDLWNFSLRSLFVCPKRVWHGFFEKWSLRCPFGQFWYKLGLI